MRRFLLASVAVTAAATLPAPAFAWGEQGHSAVCELAYRNFTPTARLALVDLFKAWSQKQRMRWQGTRNEQLLYKRFMNSCMFEDVVKNRPELRSFADQPGHFVNYPRTKAAIPDREAACSRTSSGQEAKCIYKVLDRDLGIFRDTARAPADRAEALIGIGHWLGDIHQPLHISFADDKGGGAIKISGICGRSGNLHSVWDSCLIMKGLWEPLRIANGFARTSNKRTIAHRLVDGWRRRESEPAVRTAINNWVIQTQSWQWAQESYGVTLEGDAWAFTANQYCYKTMTACSYDIERDRYQQSAGERRVDIDGAYISRFAPIVETRIRQAGYRLAWIVNATLDTSWDRKLPICSQSLGTCPI